MTDDTAAWALTFMRTATSDRLPLYGSPEFLRSNGLTRLASAVRAAEAWRRDGDAHVLAAQLDVELEAARRYDEADYQDWKKLAGRVRAMATEPTFDQLQRRRAS